MVELRNHFEETSDIQDQLSDQLENLKHIKIPQTILYSIIGGIVLIILIFIYVQYRRYRTRQLYDETPENFTKKPDLSLFQNLNLKNKNFKALSPEDYQTIEKKQNFQGQYYQLTIRDYPSCLYYENIVKESAYFQIQVIQLNSIVEIGFIHKEQFVQLYKNEEGADAIVELDKLGLSLNTDGSVVLYGQSKYPYRWNLDYGDVIGIAITESKTQKRAWVSKNGMLMNPANNEEMLKNIDLSKEEAQEKGDFGSKKKTQEVEGGVEEDKFYAKKKLLLKNTKKMKYYPVIVAKNGQGNQPTIINVNVGGQIFRMYDEKLIGGILV